VNALATPSGTVTAQALCASFLTPSSSIASFGRRFLLRLRFASNFSFLRLLFASSPRFNDGPFFLLPSLIADLPAS